MAKNELEIGERAVIQCGVTATVLSKKICIFGDGKRFVERYDLKDNNGYPYSYQPWYIFTSEKKGRCEILPGDNVLVRNGGDAVFEVLYVEREESSGDTGEAAERAIIVPKGLAKCRESNTYLVKCDWLMHYCPDDVTCSDSETPKRESLTKSRKGMTVRVRLCASEIESLHRFAKENGESKTFTLFQHTGGIGLTTTVESDFDGIIEDITDVNEW